MDYDGCQLQRKIDLSPERTCHQSINMATLSDLSDKNFRVLMMSNEIELRQAVEKDAQTICSLTRKAYAKWVPLIGREPLPMLADYDEALKRHRFDLLFFSGELAALIETISHEDYLHIENVAVLPSHQGKGLGRKLLDHAEQLAASLEYRTIKLTTNKLFAENLTFYARHGYQVEREEKFLGGICVHMCKAISQ